MPSQLILDDAFINIVRTLKSLSKCVSYQVAAILVKDNNIISIGYNGTPSGYINCRDVFKDYDAVTQREQHKEFSNKFEIHAEMNALLKCNVDKHGATMYVYVEPCWDCCKNMIAAGITRIVYYEKYDRMNFHREAMVKFLTDCDVKIEYYGDLHQ